jgi:WD40 repeat protein
MLFSDENRIMRVEDDGSVSLFKEFEDSIGAFRALTNGRIIVYNCRMDAVFIDEIELEKCGKSIEDNIFAEPDIVVSPDETDVVVVRRSDTIVVYDISTGVIKATIENTKGVWRDRMVYTPDGQHLLVSETRNVEYYETVSYTRVRSFVCCNTPAFTMTVSSDSKHVGVFPKYRHDPVCGLYEIDSQEFIHVFVPGSTKGCFMPDGSIVYSRPRETLIAVTSADLTGTVTFSIDYSIDFMIPVSNSLLGVFTNTRLMIYNLENHDLVSAIELNRKTPGQIRGSQTLNSVILM